MQEHHTFLFSVTSRTVIDASRGGNEARFINHSCDPNCETEIEKGRVYVFALRDIPLGEELNYDYGKNYFNEFLKDICACPKCEEKRAAAKKAPARAAARKRAARKVASKKTTSRKTSA